MAVRYHTDGCSYRLPQKRLTAAWLRRVAEQEGYTLAEVDYIFCSAERLLEMNRQYLGHDYFTDVITFDYSDRRRNTHRSPATSSSTWRRWPTTPASTAPRPCRRCAAWWCTDCCTSADCATRRRAPSGRCIAKEDKYLRFWETPQK